MKIGKNTNPLVINESNGMIHLMPVNGIPNEKDVRGGIIVGEKHNYNGIILERDGRKSIEYTLTNAIAALSCEGDIIVIYESGNNEPWLLRTDGVILDYKGELKEQTYTIPSTKEERKKSSEDIEIVIEADILNGYINYRGEKNPLTRGLVVGDDIYGFKVRVNIENSESTVVYPTHASIYGIELNNNNIRVFERDKSIPWTFSKTGFLINEAEYNKLLRSEQEAYCKRYGLTQEDLKKELGFDPSYPERKLS